jgi:hypothetical protein
MTDTEREVIEAAAQAGIRFSEWTGSYKCESYPHKTADEIICEYLGITEFAMPQPAWKRMTGLYARRMAEIRVEHGAVSAGHRRRVTDDVRAAVMREAASGEVSHRIIAQRLGIAGSTVSNIIRNKRRAA